MSGLKGMKVRGPQPKRAAGFLAVDPPVPQAATIIRSRYLPGSSIADETYPNRPTLDYAQLEQAYDAATLGDDEPSCGIMPTAAIINLYRKSHPQFSGTDDDILSLLRQSKLVVSFDGGIWVLCRDEAMAAAIRENGLP